MNKKSFGTTKKGEAVSVYTLENSNGMKVELLDFGAIIKNIFVPGKDGVTRDVVLGFDNLAAYEENPSFFGAVIAPSANRIGGGKFTIDGVSYQVNTADGGNNLHSDFNLGAHKRVWAASEVENGVCFSIRIADSDMGFPGNKEISVTYVLTDDNSLKLHYTASSDKNTIINPTNHAYFNLSGHKAGKITDHVLTLMASNFTPTLPGSIPTGEIKDVTGTVMDFTKGRRIGQDIDDSYDQLVLAGGYDHNFAVDGYDCKLKKIAVVSDPASGGEMTVFTDLPGVQFYAGNFIATQDGKEGAKYGKRDGLCLETQFFPDSVNHANFPSCIFGPGRNYESTTVYTFKY